METVALIFNLCIFPLLAIVAAYVIKFIQAKTNEITSNSNNDLEIKYTNMISETIIDCVIATNQTYVDTLKKQNKFDGEAQKIAFQKTYDAVVAMLTEDAKEYLVNIYGDLSVYLTAKIEAEVNRNK